MRTRRAKSPARVTYRPDFTQRRERLGLAWIMRTDLMALGMPSRPRVLKGSKVSDGLRLRLLASVLHFEGTASSLREAGRIRF